MYHYPEPKDLKPDQSQKDMLPVDVNNHTCDVDRYITLHTYNFDKKRKRIILNDTSGIKQALPLVIDPDMKKLLKTNV